MRQEQSGSGWFHPWDQRAPYRRIPRRSPKGLGKSLTQDNAGIFRGVVKIDVKIAFGPKGMSIKLCLASCSIMWSKADTRRHVVLPCAIGDRVAEIRVSLVFAQCWRRPAAEGLTDDKGIKASQTMFFLVLRARAYGQQTKENIGDFAAWFAENF